MHELAIATALIDLVRVLRENPGRSADAVFDVE
jgi:hypothetical protein